jgi:hypothetical protein
MKREATDVEIREAIKELGNKKAPGISDITHDMMKLIREPEIIEFIKELTNECINNIIMPTAEKLVKIINLPKVKDWAGSCPDLRPISLIETIKKIISKILAKRLTLIIDNNDLLKGLNFGFRTGQSTAEALYILRNLIDLSHLQSRNLLMSSLDIKKAYDTVPFEGIEASLKRLGMPQRLIRFIMLLVTERDIIIDTAFGPTQSFRPTRGLP